MTEITKEAIDTALSETPFIPNDGNRAWMKAAITAALSTLPIAGEGKVKALTKTQIETLANNIHNSDDYAYTVECLTYHLSTPPSSPGKDGGQEPVLFVSEQQLPACIGTYLPTRKHREGNFQMPLYARPQPTSRDGAR